MDDIRIPARLDELFQIPAVCRGRIWDIMVREPSLELRLMPLVVCYIVNRLVLALITPSPRTSADAEGSLLLESQPEKEHGGGKHIPALENQLLPATFATRARETRAPRNLILLAIDRDAA